MNFKTKSLITLLIISVFLLSSCEVYKTLYGTSPEEPTGQVIAPADEDIIDEEFIDIEDVMEEDLEEITEEEVIVDEELEEVIEDDLEEIDEGVVIVDVDIEDVFEEDEVILDEDDLVLVEDTEEELEVEVIEETEEVMEEKPREKPIVVLVQETDLINLVPQAEDPDKDTDLVFTFTSPLDENGQWQTEYGDTGEYTITVTVSDGESTTTRDVLIIINKKEEQPTIDGSKPIESGLLIDETFAIDFSVVASDLNNDPLSYTWKLDGVEVGTESQYTYQTTYEDSGTHTVKIDVSDGLSTTSKIWSIDVENVNRKPALELIDDITVDETDEIVITALATDDDKDSITYTINDEIFAQDDNIFTWQTDYDSAGTYEITISASDGQDTTEEEFTVTVENVNRPPVIIDIVQG